MVFPASDFEVIHDEVLDMYTLKITLPEPQGPLVFGVDETKIEDLIAKLQAAIA